MGIPVVQVASLISIAEGMGTNRALKGIGIPYPLGNPELSPMEEMELRSKLVASALELLTKKLR